MRIAHVIPDSPFLPFVTDVFESAAAGRNVFVVYAAKGDLSRHGIPSSVPLELVTVDDEGSARAAEVVANSDIAVLHSVGVFAAKALLAAPAGTLTVWSGWGGDYYGSRWSAMAGLLDPLTRAYDRSRLSLAGKAHQLYRRARSAPILRAAAERADVFSAPIPDDFDVFRSRFAGFRGRYAQLNYASVEDTYAASGPVGSGDDILVGNSATMPNNHLDVFDVLARVHVPGRRIVTPLSYGDRLYADAVTARGHALFGADFVPFREFMPLHDYQAVIADCSTVVMGHRRQQAIGNVASALWSGSHVVLHDASPLFAFLRRQGAVVSGLSELSGSAQPFAGRVSDDELARNRAVLTAFWGRNVVLDNIRALVDPS
ncbi:TDP-N-acetylfucosamine:lipid II N-acetylfucosaminyltransferase [Microbacterium sp.]|uniref:TDP-N-acetylfucosamine:lipid II N-acetylfucosaminyltransferase n=1 Tax=Microbacterium sp. TaxID=51671 RepID=UPI003F6FE434